MNYYSYMNQKNSVGAVAMDALGGTRAPTTQQGQQGASAGKKSPKEMSLEAHDRKFHPNGYKPGDTCKFREGLEAYGDQDDLGDALNWKKEGNSYYLTPVHSSARFVKEVPAEEAGFNGKRVTRARLPEGTDPNKRLEAMYALAEANIGTLNTIMEGASKDAGAEVANRPPNNAYKGLPIKTWVRAKQKADTWNRYNDGTLGDYTQLNDLIGSTLILGDDSSYADALEHLDANVRKFGAEIAQVKPLNLTTGKPGYRDLKVTLRFQNGGLGEVIIMEDFMKKQKFENGGHCAYDAYRTFDGMMECGDKSVEPLANDVDEMMNMLYERDASKIDDKKFTEQKKRVGDAMKRILANPDTFMAKMPEDYRRDLTDASQRQQFFEQERYGNLKAIESVMNPIEGDPNGRSRWDLMRLADPKDRINLSNPQQPSQRPLTPGSQT